MGDGYVKIYGDRLRNSSLWLESKETRLVFVEMLAIADFRGWVNTPSVRVLANALNMSVEDTEAALAVLEAPDLESRTETDDGRRLVRSQGGWQIVNYEFYREFRTERQESARARMKRLREEKRKAEFDSNANACAPCADHSQRAQECAPPVVVDVDASESQISSRKSEVPESKPRAGDTGLPEPWGPTVEPAPNAWTQVAQESCFKRLHERHTGTIAGMFGRSVGSFHADVLRTAELQNVDPRTLFTDAAERWFAAGLSSRARSSPYACFQTSWGDLTSKAAEAPTGVPETSAQVKARAGKALSLGDHAEVARLMARAKELEAAEEARRGRR